MNPEGRCPAGERRNRLGLLIIDRACKIAIANDHSVRISQRQRQAGIEIPIHSLDENLAGGPQRQAVAGILTQRVEILDGQVGKSRQRRVGGPGDSPPKIRRWLLRGRSHFNDRVAVALPLQNHARMHEQGRIRGRTKPVGSSGQVNKTAAMELGSHDRRLDRRLIIVNAVPGVEFQKGIAGDVIYMMVGIIDGSIVIRPILVKSSSPMAPRYQNDRFRPRSARVWWPGSPGEEPTYTLTQ